MSRTLKLLKSSLIICVLLSLTVSPLLAQNNTEIELLDRIVASQNAAIEAQRREIASLMLVIEQKNVIIDAKEQQIEEWKGLAGAKGMSRGAKARLILSIAGSVASVVVLAVGKGE